MLVKIELYFKILHSNNTMYTYFIYLLFMVRKQVCLCFYGKKTTPLRQKTLHDKSESTAPGKLTPGCNWLFIICFLMLVNRGKHRDRKIICTENGFGIFPVVLRNPPGCVQNIKILIGHLHSITNTCPDNSWKEVDFMEFYPQ